MRHGIHKRDSGAVLLSFVLLLLPVLPVGHWPLNAQCEANETQHRFDGVIYGNVTKSEDSLHFDGLVEYCVYRYCKRKLFDKALLYSRSIMVYV